MTYIIAEPCIGTKDTACVDVCPVDCIHPTKHEAEAFQQVHQLYIDPQECIDCGACEPVCPIEASASAIARIRDRKNDGSVTPREGDDT